MKEKIEIQNLIDATPFSNTLWEKDQLVKTMNIKLTATSNEEETELNWNLFSEQGLAVNKGEESRVGTDVAVIDTGIIDHDEFRNKLLKGYDFISDQALSFDGDGRDNDYRPEKSETNNCPEVSGDIISHGTHVTGIIASEGVSEDSNIGISPHSSILPIRVLGPCGGSLIDVIDSMLWSAGVPVDGVPDNENLTPVINLSLGGFGKCPAGLQDAIDVLLAKGVITVVAAGNSSIDLDSSDFFPANCKRVVAVGATNVNGNLSTYSNYGEKLIYAPGGDHGRGIYSTFVSDDNNLASSFGIMMGTSMSAPHVSALVAIIKSHYPEIGIGSVRDILIKSRNVFGVVSYKNLISILDDESFKVSNEAIDFQTDSLLGEREDNSSVMTCGSTDIGGGGGGKQAVLFSLLAGIIFCSLVDNTWSRA